MTSLMYKDQLPDWGDLENTTGDHPGYRLYVEENDGWVGVSLQPTDKNEGSCEDAYTVALTIEKAEELIKGIQDAIARAKPKHP